MTVHSLFNRFYYGVFMAIGITFCSPVLSQKVVDVDLFTGAAQVSVPVGSVQAGDINFPLVFSYHGGGVRVDDSDQRYGLGWSFSAEAGIIRVLKGFPDDIQFQNIVGGPVLKGWLKNTGTGTAVENFVIANNGTPPTCTNETSDYSYMNTNLPDHYDTEPDIFVVNVPGLNFQFVFDKSQQIKVIPYQDVKVEYTWDPYNNTIASFTVTNDRGIKYVFAKTYPTYQHIDEVITPSTLAAFKRDYMFYRHDAQSGWVSYASKWYITSISDTKANSLQFTYDTVANDFLVKARERIKIIKYNSGTASYDAQFLYQKQFSYIVPRIKAIRVIEGGVGSGGDPDVNFAFLGTTGTASIGSMRFGKTGVTAGCALVGPFNKTNDPNQPGRKFLSEIGIMSTGPNCYGATQTYKFTYYNVDFTNMTSYCTGVDSITNAQDYWGYYNGAVSNTDLTPPVWVYPDNVNVDKFKITPIPGYSGTVVALPGVNRSVNSNAVAGSLKRIIYPNGGVSEIEYENNNYLDADVNSAVSGGGIRVKKVSHNDGLNTNDVTFYEYNDPLTGITTGRAISVPEFAFAIQNSNPGSTWEDKVKNSTYRTLYDYSEGSKQVIYGKVTVRKTNGGKSVYEFATPGTRRSSATGDWYETQTYLARETVPSPCTVIEPATYFANGKYQYPFPPNPNIDFERGLPAKITHYNETGDPVSEESFTYQNANTSATKIVGLKFDNASGVRSYSKYDILTTQSKLMITHATKTYNYTNPNLSVYTSETESFTYPSGTDPHRLPTMIQKQNSDGATFTTRMKYAKDYTNTTGTGNDMEQAIHLLKQKNNNAVIETTQSVTISGTEKFVSGSIAMYKNFAGEFVSTPLPYEGYRFISPAGIPSGSFVHSSINASNNFERDNVYYKTGTVLKYDDIGNAISVTDDSRIVKGALYSNLLNLKIAEFQNAKPEELLYANFDYQSYPYTMTGYSTLTTPGRNSTNCFTFTTGSTISGTITKGTTNTHIIFSCWLKDAASAGNIVIQLTGTGFNTSYNLPFTADTKWKYYELRIPKPSPSLLTVTLSTNDVGVKIDDVLVYPANASIKTNSYTQFTDTHSNNKGIHLTGESGMNGTGKSYQYDNFWMPFVVRDADDNIVQINVLRKAQADWLQLGTPGTITWNTPVYATVPVTISSSLPVIAPCDAAVSFTWNFGDGTPEVTTSTASVQHTYATSGQYVVTVYISAPGFVNSATVSSPAVNSPGALTVGMAPVYPTICAAGIILSSPSQPCVFDPNPCAGMTESCTNTKFKVSSITGGSGGVDTYVWEKAPIGTNDWVPLVDEADNVTVTFTATGRSKTQSYKMRCTVYMLNGQVGTSNEITVTNNN